MDLTLQQVQERWGYHENNIYDEYFDRLHQILEFKLKKEDASVDKLQSTMMEYAGFFIKYILHQKEAMSVIKVVSRQFAIRVLREMQEGWNKAIDITQDSKAEATLKSQVISGFSILINVAEGWIRSATRDTIKMCDMCRADRQLNRFAEIFNTKFQFPEECLTTH